MNPWTHEALQIAHRELCATRRSYINWDEFMAEHGRWNHHYLILGHQKNAYDRCCKTSLIDEADTPYPLHSLTRPYLRALTYLQGRETPRVIDYRLLLREPPLYFPTAFEGPLAQVDIVAAYWQIYSPTSFDLEYDGVTTPHNGHLRFLGIDELLPHRSLRNAIIGTARAEFRTESDHGIIKKVACGTTWQRPDLWAYMQDLLHAIAWEMRALFAAVHIHTDGYVIRGDLTEDAITYLREVWGLEAIVKASGEGRVRGLGCWQIGDVIAGDIDIPFPGEPVDNMASVDNSLDLRLWHLDAQEYKSENKYISSKKGLQLIW